MKTDVEGHCCCSHASMHRSSVLPLPDASAALVYKFSNAGCLDGLTSVQGYLEAFDELDDPSNSQQAKQLLDAQQLTHLQSQLSMST